MAEGRFYGGGVQRFQKEGGSIQEQDIELPGKGFEEKLIELRTGDAADVVRKYSLGRDVEYLLSRYRQDPRELSKEVCEQFLRENPQYKGYHPALVRAVAEEIVAERQALEAQKSVKH